MQMAPTVILPVRRLAEFLLRGGSIDNRFGGVDSATEGSRIHRWLQKQGGKDYRSEVWLTLDRERGGINYRLEGRADGIVDEALPVIDEIKTLKIPLDRVDENFNRAHWGQAQCYAAMYSLLHNEGHVAVQLTYVRRDADSPAGIGEIKRFRREFSRDELIAFLDGLLEEYGEWARRQLEWAEKRDASIRALSFPYGAYRPGQREMAAAVYRTIAASGRLFSQAPTGIGKTVSTLFPAVKAVGEGLVDRLFYLTAKTITRQAAEQALERMETNGLRFKSVTLTAQDKICFLGERRECQPETCPYANGHYDRVNEALRALLDSADRLTRPVVERCAREHRVCPFELALDAALWCDGIIGDYNYAFDPQVYLRRFFQEVTERYVFLVDEAHNLVDRAREMYSAGLNRSDFTRAVKRLPPRDPVKKPLRAVGNFLRDRMEEGQEVRTEEKALEELNHLLEKAVEQLGTWLESHPEADGETTDLFFSVTRYLKIAEIYDDCYVTMLSRKGSEISLRQLCLDPSRALDGCMKRARASILFSATLTPLSYFAAVLGGDDNTRTQALPSPYDPKHLDLVILDRISTRYRHREDSLGEVCEAIARTVRARRGNYLVYFPSYTYMQSVAGRFQEEYPDISLSLQTSHMEEEEREAFLEQFDAGRDQTLVGFCVLGGIYAEGIDLQGGRLIGTVVVGVGLPQISPELNLLREYFDRQGQPGYDFAYTFPGMNKVLQAVGRVIRGEEDRGVAVLIDDRFTSPGYRRLYPAHWSGYRVARSGAALERELAAFWKDQEALQAGDRALRGEDPLHAG